MSPELDPVVALNHLRATWFGESGLGFDGSTIRPQLFPLVLGAYCFRKAGLSAESVCRLWYAFLFVLQGLGVSALAATVLRHRLSRKSLLVIASFAVINPYELISLHGPYLTTQLSVAAIPALLAMAIRYVRSRRLSEYLICLVIIACVATGDANPAVFIVQALAFLTIALCSIRPSSLAQLCALALAYIGTNAIWIAPSYLTLKHDLPFLAPASAQYSDDTLRVVSQFSAWPHSLRLVGEYLFFNNVAGHPYLTAGANYDSNAFLIFFTWIVPACALAGLIIGVRLRETEIITIGGITLVSLFLAKGTSPPFGSVFAFLSDHSVVFRGFRDSFGKFEWIVVIAYALLLGRFLQAVAAHPQARLRSIVLTLICAAVLVSGYPILTGQLFWSHVVVKIPDRYFRVASFLNHQNQVPTIAEVPLAPDVFDSYRWGYVGAGINSQLTEGPLLSGSSRLLSPINDRLADLLEHENAFSSGRVSSWLGLFGFNGILADTTSDPSIFAPNQGVVSFSRHVSDSQIAWQQGGLSYVKFNDTLVNPRVYAARSVVVGTHTVRQIALACVALHSCKSLAFVERLVPGAGIPEDTVLSRQPLYWSPHARLRRVLPGTRVFVDDASHTYEVFDGRQLPPLHTVFPTDPAVVTIAFPGAPSGNVDAYVTGDGSSLEAVHLCADPNSAKELEIRPDARASGLGLIALAYDGDRTARADLIISSRAGPSQTRLDVGAYRQAIVRTLPLGLETRARIVLEPRPVGSCIDLHVFAFAQFSSRSSFTRFPWAQHGEPTLYQTLNPDPLRSYVDAAKIHLSPSCAIACGHRELASDVREVALHDVTPASLGSAETASGVGYCSSAGAVVYRGEGMRLIPGVRYRLSLRAVSDGAARVRTAILSEDELGVAEGARDIGSGRIESLTLPFVASGSLQNAVLYAWIDQNSYNAKTCILSATIQADAPDIDLQLTQQNLAQPSLTSEEIGRESYRIRMSHLGHIPALLVLNQTYDDRWTAISSLDTRLEHVSVNGGVNGWIVRGSNDSDITLRYSGSDITRSWFIFGSVLVLSALGIAMFIARSVKNESGRGSITFL